MSPESESDRIGRIREAQIGARGTGHKQRSAGTKNSSKKSKAKNEHNTTKAKNEHSGPKPKISLPLIRANTASNAVHDVLVGIGIGAIPALLGFLFLPGGFKLLGILVLLVGGAGGYLLGETAK